MGKKDQKPNVETPANAPEREVKLAKMNRLIEAFDEGMRSLTGGEKIPKEWKSLLLKAVNATPKKRPGKEPDYATVAETVKRLALLSDKVRAPLSNAHNPAVYKDQIAAATKTNRKAVERVDVHRPDTFNQLGRLESLDPKMREAYIKGLSEAVWALMSADFEAEEAARENEARRRIRRAAKDLE